MVVIKRKLSRIGLDNVSLAVSSAARRIYGILVVVNTIIACSFGDQFLAEDRRANANFENGFTCWQTIKHKIVSSPMHHNLKRIFASFYIYSLHIISEIPGTSHKSNILLAVLSMFKKESRNLAISTLTLLSSLSDLLIEDERVILPFQADRFVTTGD